MSNSKSHPLEKIYYNMMYRCYEKESINYGYYGGRGIRVCDRWNRLSNPPGIGFKNFVADMGERPSDLYTLDRINDDGDYEPSNCRWATKSEQCRNRRIFSTNKSGFPGINYNRAMKKWHVRIGVNNVRYHLGFFDKLEDTVCVRNHAQMLLWDKETIWQN